MIEVLIVLSLFVALGWVIARAILIFVRVETPADGVAPQTDPISTYIDENYGSHFVDDPISVNRSLCRK